MKVTHCKNQSHYNILIFNRGSASITLLSNEDPLHSLFQAYDSDDGSSYCEDEDDESWGSEWEEDFGDEPEETPPPEVCNKNQPNVGNLKRPPKYL